MKKSELRQIIKEEISKVLRENEMDQSYRVISKEPGPGGNIVYRVFMGEETYTTREGLTFNLEAEGLTFGTKGEPLNLNDPVDFHMLWIKVKDEAGDMLVRIPGESVGSLFDLKPSMRKAKRWLDKNGSRISSGGRGYQFKDT